MTSAGLAKQWGMLTRPSRAEALRAIEEVGAESALSEFGLSIDDPSTRARPARGARGARGSRTYSYTRTPRVCRWGPSSEWTIDMVGDKRLTRPDVDEVFSWLPGRFLVGDVVRVVEKVMGLEGPLARRFANRVVSELADAGCVGRWPGKQYWQIH
jgi:hypothetical protein